MFYSSSAFSNESSCFSPLYFCLPDITLGSQTLITCPSFSSFSLLHYITFILISSFPYNVTTQTSVALINPSLPLLQAQLIHDRNTASHATLNDKADTGPERVHMTWTKDKLFTERNRNRECNANMAVRDLFNMKP